MKKIEAITSTTCRTLYIICLTTINYLPIVLSAAIMLVLEAVLIWAKSSGLINTSQDSAQPQHSESNFGKLLLIKLSIDMVPFLMIAGVLYLLLRKLGLAGIDLIEISTYRSVSPPTETALFKHIG